MIKVLYNLILKYIVPLLKFAGVYITEEGYLRPIGLSEDSVYQYNEKDIIVAKHDLQYDLIRERKDSCELFNPFFVPRHMVFIANLMLARVNEIDEPPAAVKKVAKIKSKLTYDEDLDSYVADENTDEETLKNLELTPHIEMKHARDLNGYVNDVSFQYVNKDGNPIIGQDPIAKFTAITPVLATYGAMVELLKKYQRTIPPELADTLIAVTAVQAGILRYEREREHLQKELKGIQAQDLSDNDIDNRIYDSSRIEFDLSVFKDVSRYAHPYTMKRPVDRAEYFYHNRILPTFTVIDGEPLPDQSFETLLNHDKYADIELRW
jgi:hypothetical protein